MNSEAKIPTLLALGILLVGIAVGVYSVSQTKTIFTKADTSTIPKNITVSDISFDSVSISWQTDAPISSFVDSGPTENLGTVFLDDRDSNPSPHNLHFVTLKNLTPSTAYFYKITSGSYSYPQTLLTFKTTSKLDLSNNQPLIGTVLREDGQPVTEALVKLEISQAQILITITKGNGSFILPLTEVKDQSFTKPYQIPPNTQATLTVEGQGLISQVNLTLPYKNPVLPTITLGQNLNLIEPTPTSTLPPPSPTTSSKSVLGVSTSDIKRYDLDHDGKVTVLDLSILISNMTKPKPNPQADLNGDGVVDEKDIEILQSVLNSQ